MITKRMLALALGSFPTAAIAGPYAFVEGGVAWSFDRSNTDEVEFGDEPGGSLALGAGFRFPLADRWSLDGEAQVIGQVIPLHGRNDQREATADGRYFWLAGLTINGWVDYSLDDRWSLYGGGGAGPAVVTAFGSSGATGVGHRWRGHPVRGERGGEPRSGRPVLLDGAGAPERSRVTLRQLRPVLPSYLRP